MKIRDEKRNGLQMQRRENDEIDGHERCKANQHIRQKGSKLRWPKRVSNRVAMLLVAFSLFVFF